LAEIRSLRRLPGRGSLFSDSNTRASEQGYSGQSPIANPGPAAWITS